MSSAWTCATAGDTSLLPMSRPRAVAVVEALHAVEEEAAMVEGMAVVVVLAMAVAVARTHPSSRASSVSSAAKRGTWWFAASSASITASPDLHRKVH
jgi:hypothetical protein